MNSKKNSGPGSTSPNSKKTPARVLHQKPSSAKGDPGGNQVEVIMGGNETLLLKAFNNCPLLMTISDLKTGRYLLVNDCFCRVSEIPRHEALGRTSVEIGWIEEQEQVRMVRELQRHGKISGLEITLHSKSGKSIFCNYSGDILETTSGTWLFSTAEDITFRKRVEKQQEILYRVLLAVSGMLDPDQIASSAVDTIVRLTGYPHVCIALPDETGTHWVVRGAAGNLAAELGTAHPIHQGVIGRAFKKGKIQRVVDVLKEPGYIREVRKANELTLRSEFVTPIRHADNLLGALNIESDRVDAFDEIDAKLFQLLAEIIALALENARSFHEAQQEIAEHKRTEQTLQETNALLSLFMKHSPIYSFIKQVTPTESRVLKASENYKDMTGIPGSEMTGMTMQELFPPKFAKKITEDDWAVASDGKVLRLEESFNGRDYDTFKYPILLGNKNLLAGYTIDITERKRFEQILRESESRFRTLIDQAPVAIIVSRDGISLYANQKLRALYGSQDEREGVGRPIMEYFATQFQEQSQERTLRRIQGLPVPAEFESVGMRQDGTNFPIHVAVAQVMLSDGRANIAFVTDISGRKQAEEGLKKSEQTARQTAEQLKMVNQIGLKITAGLEFEQLLHTIYEECQKIGATDTFYVALYDESNGRLSFPFFYKDGKQREVASRNLRENAGVAGCIIEQRRTLYIPDESHMPDGITPVRTPGLPTNSYIGVPLIVNDRIVGVMSMQSHAINAYSREQITTLEFLATQVAIAIQNSQLYERIQKELVERRQAEERIREAQILLQASIESPKDMIILSINKNFQYLNFNSYHHEIMKISYGKDVRIGMNLLDCITNPEDRRKSKENYERALNGINHTTIEEYGDLERSFYETRYNPIFNDKDEIVGATAFSANISARIRAEEEIRLLNTNLEQRVKERTRDLRDAQEKLVRQEKLAVLGQLAGGVGHELRNPLSVINTAVYYLKLVQPDASEKVKQHLVMIEQEVATAGKIISDLLDFARIKSVDREVASVPELVQGTLVRFPPAPTIETVLKFPPGLPKIFADPRQVEQVLGNLTINACQAMQAGGALTISARLSKGMVAIAVKDTGTGITPENMKRLFEPLFTTKTKGIGLGLAVSQKLAETNGGRIDVESEPGQGSTFTLWLPSHPPSEIEESK
jgi:PAS domain S-box-containing protein